MVKRKSTLIVNAAAKALEDSTLTELSEIVRNGSPEDKAKARKAIKTQIPDDPTTNETTAADASVLVTNNEFVTNQFEEITFNLLSANRRHEILEGRNYTVVPMVMITEGVHAGSNGPLYYASEELNKTPAVWDHKPIVAEHPVENGNPVSACSPAVISRRKIGLIMNTKYISARGGKPGRLSSEAWIEPESCKRVDNRILDAVNSGKMVEVSTGLFCDNEKTEGMWKKEKYEAKVHNIRPDHLAVLFDEVGSCSIADGAGMNRNSRGASMNPIREKYVDELIANSEIWGDDDRLSLLAMEPEAFAKTLATHNSYCETEKEITVNFKKMPSGQDVISDDGGDDQGETIEDAKSQIAAKKGGKDYKGTKNKGADKSDASLKNKPKKTPAEDKADKDDAGNDGASSDGKGVMNQQQTPLTMNQYIEQAPEGIREVLQQGVATLEANKRALIGIITANKANKFAPKFLATKSLQELDALAALAASGNRITDDGDDYTANYIGAGADVGGLTANAGADDEPLGLIPEEFGGGTNLVFNKVKK